MEERTYRLRVPFFNLQAATAAEEGKPALLKFTMTAYTGGAMRLGGWPYPVVVDLAGTATFQNDLRSRPKFQVPIRSPTPKEEQ